MSDAESKPHTISTVARRAGVSPATVSRVMNRPESVSADKRIRVQRVMEELDYSPNPLARGMVTDSLGIVGIIVPNITNQANARIVYGAMDTLEKRGFSVLLFDAREDLEREMKIYRTLPRKLVDGVIVIYGNGTVDEYDSLRKNLPIVLAGPPAMELNVDQLTCNENLGFQNLIQYLYGMGHRDIGFLYGSEETGGGRRRRQLFTRAMTELGFRETELLLQSCEWTLEGGYDGASRLFAGERKPTAVIGSSDQIAIGAMRFLGERNLNLPADVSVVGFDNSPMSRYVSPSLTTLDFPHTRMGEMAAELLVRQIKGKNREFEVKTLPLEIIVRESSGPPVRKEH